MSDRIHLDIWLAIASHLSVQGILDLSYVRVYLTFDPSFYLIPLFHSAVVIFTVLWRHVQSGVSLWKTS